MEPNNPLKLGVMLLVAAIFLPLVFSEELNEPLQGQAETLPAPDYYTEQTNYWNPDFYSTSNPAKWQWNKVDWGLVDFSRPELYSLNQFYQNLPKEAYDKLDYSKVQYNNKNLDYKKVNHEKVNPNKFAKDVGCIDCKISIESARIPPADCVDCSFGSDESENWEEKKVKVTYSKEGITHANGDFVSIPSNLLSPGVLVNIISSGIELYLPLSVTEIAVPSKKDTVTINTFFLGILNVLGEEHPYLGVERELTYKGNSVKGSITFRKGQPQVTPGAETIINHVSISGYGPTGQVNLFFDGEKHSGDYVSTTSEKMIVGRGDGSKGDGRRITLSFLPKNDFFEVTDGDKLEMTPGFGSMVQIQSRPGLIPLVTVTGGGHGTDLDFTNGMNEYHLARNGKDTNFKVGTTGEGSVPFTLHVIDKEGNPGVNSEGQAAKLVFDNTNNFYSIPFETSKDEVECISCAQDLSESRYLYDFSMIKIKNLAPFLQVEGEDAIGVKNLLKGLKKLPPAVRDSLIQVKLVSEDEILAQCGMNAWGCEYGGTVWIPDSGPSWPTGIYHEAAHARTDQLQSEIIKHEVGEEYISYTSYALELKRKYNQEYKPRVRFYTAEGENTENFCESCSVKVVWPNEDGTRLIEKPGVVTETEKKEIAELWSNYYFTDIGPDSRKSNFEKKWEVVAGPVYGEGLGEKIVAGHNAAKWKDGTDAPKNGVIMAYGANNFWEDVATFVEPFAEKNHDFFKQYISPSSPQYDGRYEEKLKLLYEYGFITEMDYLDVMSYKEE